MPKPSTSKWKTVSAKSAPAKKKLKSARPPPGSSSSSGSDSDSDSDNDNDNDGDDRAAMLAALEAHSRSMFGFDSPAESSAQGAARSASESESESEPDAEVVEEDYDDEFDDGWGEGDAFVTDSEDGMDFDAMMSNAKKAKKTKSKEKTKPKEKKEAPKATSALTTRAPVQVVFAETGRSSVAISKAEKRAFLTGNSAKIMGLQPEEQPGSGKRKRKANADDEEEQSNQRLDKTLHDMLLNSLLPSATQDGASRPVDKRAAMSGRLLELANYSLPGDGEGVVRGANLSSHPAHVRTGLVHAKQRRAETARAEAEAAGSWVKGKGGLGDLGRRGAGSKGKEREVRTFGTVTKKKGMAGKSKERAMGLGMGVGKFDKGALRIDESTIARINNSGKSGGKKKGGGKKGMRGW